jgi:hypothetical protein
LKICVGRHEDFAAGPLEVHFDLSPLPVPVNSKDHPISKATMSNALAELEACAIVCFDKAGGLPPASAAAGPARAPG